MDHDDVVEKVQRVALAGARAALPKPAKVLADMIGEGLSVFVGTGNDRLKGAVQAEIEDGVLRRLPEVERKVSELQEQGVPINVTDVVRVVDQYARAWRESGDAKKRKLLDDAFVRSFDRELYESGLLNTLWERLDRLSYGDLVLLRDVIGSAGNRPHSKAVLEAHGATSEGGLGAFHLSNLERERLVLIVDPKIHGEPIHVNCTDLGKRLWLLAFPSPESSASPRSG